MTDAPVSIRKQVLDLAAEAVLKDRASTYGGPEQSFSTIADLWTVWWRAKHPEPPVQPRFEAADVAIFLGLVKKARLAKSPQHLDSWVDGAGYDACGAECAGAK